MLNIIYVKRFTKRIPNGYAYMEVIVTEEVNGYAVFLDNGDAEAEMLEWFGSRSEALERGIDLFRELEAEHGIHKEGCCSTGKTCFKNCYDGGGRYQYNRHHCHNLNRPCC